LAANLAGPLLIMANRVLILELNVARLEGRLSGDTPQERFLSFAERLSDTEVSGQLLHEYSELREQVANCLEKWTGFSLEFLEHACQDWAAIEGSVVGGAPGLIVGVEGGAGDTHRNGRSVMIATLSSGARVVSSLDPGCGRALPAASGVAKRMRRGASVPHPEICQPRRSWLG
jgi:lantibiotic modifying enzyme